MLNLFIKEAIDYRKVIIDLSGYCQTYQKSLEDVFASRCLNILKEQCRNTNVVFGKGIVHKML